MNRRVVRLLAIWTLPLALACDDPTDPYATLVITTSLLGDGIKNVDYAAEALQATGSDGSYSWTLASGSLPTGLILTTGGLIAGKPTVVEARSFAVEVVGGDGQAAQKTLSIMVKAPPVLQPTDLCSDHPPYAIARFEDANLEARVRAALSIGSQDDLTCELITALTLLTVGTNGAVSLTGVQNLTSLMILYIQDTPITDVGPLSGLTNLTFLALRCSTVVDVGPLGGLTNLTSLTLDENMIADIGALGGLTNLTALDISSNAIIDIGALSGLRNLTSLDVSANAITDIGALEGLTSLGNLILRDNPALTDIQPLLDNAGLGEGDSVALRGTNVSCADVTALAARGVEVASDCP